MQYASPMADTESTDSTVTDAVRDQVRAWFEEIGWQVEERTGEEALAWRLRAQNRSGQRVVAFQQAARPDIVVLGGSVAPGGPHPQKLAALDPAAAPLPPLEYYEPGTLSRLNRNNRPMSNWALAKRWVGEHLVWLGTVALAVALAVAWALLRARRAV